MGAYYHADFANCQVVSAPFPATGASTWCPDAPGGHQSYEMWRWNDLFPAYAVPIPAYCPKKPGSPQQPSGWPPIIPPSPPSSPGGGGGNPLEEFKRKKNEPSGPVTGDPPAPPPVECAPAVSVPPDDHATSSQFSRTGSISGQGGGFGYGPIDQLGQPQVASMTPLAVYTSNGTPTYTQSPKLEIIERPDGGTQVDSFHEGTGPGILCFHPPELIDHMLHGSGVNADSRWPTELSEVTILLHNCGRADASTGDSSVTRLAFGNPLSTSVKPKSGVYFEYSSSSGILRLSGTAANATDVDNQSFRLDDMAFDLGQYTSAARDLILNPRAGTIIWNTTTETFQYYSGSAWVSLGSGSIGGSTGASDNRLLRSDGVGGSTIQSSAITVDDSGNTSGMGTLGCGAISSTEFIKSSSPSAGIGYVTGAGGTVTQATSKSTAVTLDKVTGTITMHNAALAAGTSVTFIVNCGVYTNAVDVVHPMVVGGAAGAGSYTVDAEYFDIDDARFRLTLTNRTTGSLSEPVKIHYVILKGASA